MEFRRLGHSGLKVPVLSFGTGTFGGSQNEFFRAFGASADVDAARRLIDICLEHGVNLFDTADAYSEGESEEILGKAIQGRRDQVLLATKVNFAMGSGANDLGSSRLHLTRSLEGSLRRLQTDYIDLYQLHGFDPVTPIEETLSTLDSFVRSGKVRYIGASNFSGWHLQRSIDVSRQYGWARHISHQVYYSLVGRDYEWELQPLAEAENIGAMVWSPLGWGRLTGKIRRGQELPPDSRLHGTSEAGPPVPFEFLYDVVDALEKVAAETGKTIPQVAINWLLQQPTVATVILGARTEQQLRDNLGAVGWKLSSEQLQLLNQVSARTPAYPYWHQAMFQTARRQSEF